MAVIVKKGSMFQRSQFCIQDTRKWRRVLVFQANKGSARTTPLAVIIIEEASVNLTGLDAMFKFMLTVL